MPIPLHRLSPAQRAAYDLRTKPPPWCSPTPPKIAALAEEEIIPPFDVPRSNASWPRVWLHLMRLAKAGRTLPYLQGMGVALNCDPGTVGSAYKTLAAHGYIAIERRDCVNDPSEFRITMLPEGLVVKTEGWK